MVRNHVTRLLFLVGMVAVSAHAQVVSFRAGVLPVRWATGGPDCSVIQHDFQIHKYNDDFYILRQLGCTHFEKPFLFLMFGQQKAILFDTGAGTDIDPLGRDPKVRANVDFVIGEWLKRNNRTSIDLVVTHLHSHLDHVWGDFQFSGRPNTVVVPPSSVPALQSFFGIRRWPTDIVQYDLGGRILDIIPIPGHDPTHIAVYDRQTAVLLTGDTLYPGRLYVNQPDHDVFADSVERLVNFTLTRPVAHVLGTHIEQERPYFDNGATTHLPAVETALELGRCHLLELQEATTFRDRDHKIIQKAYRDFSVCGVYPSCVLVNKP